MSQSRGPGRKEAASRRELMKGKHSQAQTSDGYPHEMPDHGQPPLRPPAAYAVLGGAGFPWTLTRGVSDVEKGPQSAGATAPSRMLPRIRYSMER